MGFIFGIIGELIPLLAGIFCIQIFSGRRTPEFKNHHQKVQFDKLKNKHGKKLVYLGYFVAIMGGIGMLKLLFA